MKILIVDDQFTVLQSLKEAIEPSGHACNCFQDPVDALQNFTTEEYDVVITDYKMPQMNGIELLCSIQNLKPGTPVIMFTGYVEVNNIIDAINFGVFAFYRKPINIRDIMKTLEKIKNNVDTRKKFEYEFLKLKNLNKTHSVEIQHRIRNNLQIISSLLNLQINLLKNKDKQNLLKTHENRVKVIGLSYEMLNESMNQGIISLDVYIQKILQYLFLSFAPASAHVKLISQIEKIKVPIDQAIPFGLAVNEIISNTLLHAFPENFVGDAWLSVSMNQGDDVVHVNISDNGIGLIPAVNPESANTMGFKLVYSLIVNQLGGRVELDRTTGTSFTLTIKIINKEKFVHNPAFSVDTLV